MPPAQRSQRWLLFGYYLLLGTVALYACATLAAEAIVRAQVMGALDTADISNDADAGTEVQVSLWSGSVLVTDLHLRSDTISTASFRVQGTVDTIAVTGLSYRELLRDRLHMKRLTLRTHDLVLELHPDSTRPTASASPFASYRVEELDLEGTQLRATREGSARNGGSIRSFVFNGGGGRIEQEQPGIWSLRLEGAHNARLDSLVVNLNNEQCLTMAELVLDRSRGTCTIRELQFGPYDELERFTVTREIEQDVAQCHVSEVSISGLSIPSGPVMTSLSARSITLKQAEATIFRDKTRRDGPSMYKPLLARLLRELPEGAGADSLILQGSSIIYHERATVERGFGVVPFRQMDAVITGARSPASDTAYCTVRARCTTFDDTPVDFRFNTRLADTTDRYEVEAHIGGMPFHALNAVLGPLLDVQAISGRIDTIIMHMRADDRMAEGKVRLAYRNLRMVQGDVATRKARNRPLSVLMNAVIRNEQELGDISQTDERFTLARARDRSIFNYLWRGLREGSKKVLLPEMMTK